jgi:protein-L-isoaspartate(D-aspartate) O-methyltransferase
LTCTPSAIEAGVCTPAIPSRSPAIVDGASVAYLTTRRRASEHSDLARWELGAIGHGPTGDQLADRLCLGIHEWDTDRSRRPVVAAYRVNSDLEGERAICKRFIAVSIEF